MNPWNILVSCRVSLRLCSFAILLHNHSRGLTAPSVSPFLYQGPVIHISHLDLFPEFYNIGQQPACLNASPGYPNTPATSGQT